MKIGMPFNLSINSLVGHDSSAGAVVFSAETLLSLFKTVMYNDVRLFTACYTRECFSILNKTNSMKKVIFYLLFFMMQILVFSCKTPSKRDQQFKELFDIYQNLSKDYLNLEMTLEQEGENLKGTFYQVDSLGQQVPVKNFNF